MLLIKKSLSIFGNEEKVMNAMVAHVEDIKSDEFFSCITVRVNRYRFKAS